WPVECPPCSGTVERRERQTPDAVNLAIDRKTTRLLSDCRTCDPPPDTNVHGADPFYSSPTIISLCDATRSQLVRLVFQYSRRKTWWISIHLRDTHCRVALDPLRWLAIAITTTSGLDPNRWTSFLWGIRCPDRWPTHRSGECAASSLTSSKPVSSA